MYIVFFGTSQRKIINKIKYIIIDINKSHFTKYPKDIKDKTNLTKHKYSKISQWKNTG